MAMPTTFSFAGNIFCAQQPSSPLWLDPSPSPSYRHTGQKRYLNNTSVLASTHHPLRYGVMQHLDRRTSVRLNAPSFTVHTAHLTQQRRPWAMVDSLASYVRC
ncbi:hypothetical protein PAXINDRAFT_173486 [Paxillus involutus ATCC 200175]|uniref:Uncharacterized protein n=1 Tax=Paxillus involutus ATCC 200175 TaxID=664439 RepID=A0A0C9T8G1_PAXIN|nr:hypothetical protein PAXINDRAFT_173486 [Paxillus involutus ATCC 200175]